MRRAPHEGAKPTPLLDGRDNLRYRRARLAGALVIGPQVTQRATLRIPYAGTALNGLNLAALVDEGFDLTFDFASKVFPATVRFHCS